MSENFGKIVETRGEEHLKRHSPQIWRKISYFLPFYEGDALGGCANEAYKATYSMRAFRAAYIRVGCIDQASDHLREQG